MSYFGIHPVPVDAGGTGNVTLDIHKVMLGQGTAPVVGIATGTAGQVLTSAGASADPSFTTLTPSSIFPWTVITASQTAVINHGYFCNKAGTLALALPAASAVGDVIEVGNINTALGIQFTQAAGQQIFFASTSTTLGATGTLTSSAVGDTLRIVCRVANTIWQVQSSIGNWTPA